MKTLAVFLFLLPSFVFGQDDPSEKRIESISIVVTPEYGYRSLNYPSSHQWVQEVRDEHEVAHYGFSAGVRTRFRSKYKCALELGLLFANRAFKTKQEELLWNPQDPSLPGSAETIFRFKYLAIPVNINYQMAASGRMAVSLKAGVAPSVFLSAKTKLITIHENGEESTHSSVSEVGHTRFGLSGVIGVAIEYNASEKITLSIEPCYQRFLTSINANKDAKEYLFSFGAGVSARYNF